MCLILLTGLMIILLVQTTTSTPIIYYVIPEDDDITANNDTHILQHYVDNSVKYFTSNTQLRFLAGTHYFYNDLVVAHITNFSIVGANMTVVYSRLAKILLNYVDNITISNILVKGKYFTLSLQALLMLKNCSNIFIQNSTFTCHSKDCRLTISDAFGAVILHNVISDSLMLWHDHSTGHCNTTVSKYTGLNINNKTYAITIQLHQHGYKINILLSEIKVKLNKAIAIRSTTFKGNNYIKLEKTTFTGVMSNKDRIIFVWIQNQIGVFGNHLANVNMIQFDECRFIEIITKSTILILFVSQEVFLSHYSVISISNCIFYKIKSLGILSTLVNEQAAWKPKLIISIQNTKISDLASVVAIEINGIDLLLIGPVIFTKIESFGLIYTSNSQIYLQNYIEISLSHSPYFFKIKYVTLRENSRLNISTNTFITFFATADEMNLYLERDEHAWCAFQYINPQKNINKNLTFTNYSIVLENNLGKWDSTTITHCDWIDDSAFMQFNSQEVNKEIIKLVNQSYTRYPETNYICYCKNHQHYNCTIDELGPVYPGQSYVFNLAVNKFLKSDIFIKIDDRPTTACKSQNDMVDIHLLSNTCYSITYNIQSKNAKDCEIYLHGTIKILSAESIQVITNWKFLDTYRMKVKPCPLGFALNQVEGMCECDSTLSSNILLISSCNINDQTILRPSNSWIVGKINTDHLRSYQVSQRCPLDYCLPHLSYLDLSNPDSQCQFNRAGLLCGECKEGFSAVFGTSKCEQCSNKYLLLIFAFMCLGIILVASLFIFSLTVTSGNINGLIFYANIVNINTAIFFQKYQSTKYTYIIVSLLNLDLGIETCFYNGMDDYAKMWLQFLFPIYLILIAIALILASRYSSKLQRLTARKALPVLATLFLLSYTKILRSVSNVLFSYSTIIDLPSNHTTSVWLVNTKTKIFGIKFTLLFLVCIILFLILLLFNAILLFIKTAMRFKCINRFKPLLDAYLGPYQHKFYYWTGLQLLLRVVFFGISALERSTNIMISIIILGVMECIYSKECPLTSKSKNYLEMLLILNLQVLFATAWYTTSNTLAVNIMVSLALAIFICLILQSLQVLKQIQKLLTAKIVKSFLQPRSADIQHDIELHDKIPEVTHDYKEFQEPLIAQDN